MPVLLTKTQVLDGDVSAWTSTDGVSNIVVGIEGSNAVIEFDLGSDIIYTTRGTRQDAYETCVIAKANQVRVRASDGDVYFEIFS